MNEQIRKKILTRVQGMDEIPMIDRILLPLVRYLEQPFDKIDLNEVARMISYDEAIVAHCLRMANSSLFGRARPTESVHAAVVSLGLQRIQSLLISSYMGRVFPLDHSVVNPVVFWRHSLGCALVGRKLAARVNLEDPDAVHLAGLLHDLGILVNSRIFAEEFRTALTMARKHQIPLDEAELQVMGFTHCQAGRVLAEQWHLNSDICEAIEFHSSVQDAKEFRPLVSLVHLSDEFCRMRGMGYGYYESRQLDITSDPGWEILVNQYPHLKDLDLARFTFEMDNDVIEVQSLVDAVYQH
jgi:HD-like signal output (HDOD) protein